MSDSSVSETLPIPNASLPKLSIRLLFVWITLSAIGIVYSNWQYSGWIQSFEGEMRHMLRISQVIAAIGAAIVAAQFTGMGVLVFTWRKTKQLLTQPGHWLIWIVCVSMLFQIVAMGAGMLSMQIDEMAMDWTRTGWQLRRLLVSVSEMLLTGVVPIGLTVFAAIRHRGKWRICFLISVLPTLFDLLFPFLWKVFTPSGTPGPNSPLIVANNLTRVFPAVLIAYAAFSERLSGVQRDWVHWVGVGGSAVFAVMLLSYTALSVLF